VGEDPDDRQRRGDGEGREHQRQDERERPEDERKDQDRDGDGYVELADLEVMSEHRIEVVLDRRLSRHVDLRAWNLACRGPHVVRVAFGVSGLEVGHDGGRDYGVRDHLNAGQPSGRKLCSGFRRAFPHDGNEPVGRAGRALDDEAERACGLLAEVVLENLLCPVCVRSGEREAVREETAQARHGHHRHDENDAPDGHDRPAVADHRVGEMVHRGLLREGVSGG
jgi:hypothetical protein